MNLVTMPFEEALKKIPNAYAWYYTGTYPKEYMKPWFRSKFDMYQIKDHKKIANFSNYKVILTQTEYYKNICKIKDVL